MAGLYDLDLDTQVVDDWAIQWDDPDAQSGFVLNHEITDAAGITDAESEHQTRDFTDPEGITDSITFVLTINASFTDPVGITDLSYIPPTLPGLGCGVVGAAIATRSNWGVMLADLTHEIVDANFDRRLNDVSQAMIRVQPCFTPLYAETTPLSGGIIPWEHVLLLSWDSDIVWAGPIVSMADDEEGFGVIEARDIMEWMKHRKIRDSFSTVGAADDVRDIFVQLVGDGFDQDASVAYSIVSAATGITAERKYSASHAQYVYDAADELTTTGIDWTVLLDIITCGNVDINTDPIGVLNNSHLIGKPTLEWSGLDQANFVTVIGSGRGYDDDALTGLSQDAGAQTIYGLLDLIEDEPAIEDQTSLDAAASTRLDLRVTTPVRVGELALAPTAPYAHTDLVPGAVMSAWLEGSYVRFIGDLRMDTVRFVAKDGRWYPIATVQPVGTTS